MDLIIPGLARTGTKSLWRFFKTHHQVAASFEKEPIRLHGLDNYIGRFDIMSTTKMLFDGTPELTNSTVIEKLKEHPDIDNIYQIWFNRDPMKRMKSLINRLNSLTAEDLNTMPESFFSHDMEFQLKKAISLLGEKNVFVCEIDTINIEREIEDFLGIEQTTIVMPWDRHHREDKNGK
jgi:hypothetical protein